MIRTLILLSCAVSLSGCDFARSTDLIQSALRGDPAPAAFVETVAGEQPSSLEVVTVAEPEPPHVPQCWWQAWQWYYCDGVYVEPQPHNPNFD